ncbi:MAG: hypothetical protein IKQ88_00785 [Lachnospiraceae bacterium]|nr:hypothetical protein [Lachnospiraceae bacterium]
MKKTGRKEIISVIVFLVATVLLEVFLFNFRYWQNRENMSVSADLTGVETDGIILFDDKTVNGESVPAGSIVFTGEQGSIIIGLPEEVRRSGTDTIEICADMIVNEEGWEDYNDGIVYTTLYSNMTELVLTVPEPDSSTPAVKSVSKLVGRNEEEASYVCFKIPAGTGRIRLDIKKIIGMGIVIRSLKFNTPVPFKFSFIRIFLILLMAAFVYVLRPGSVLWEKRILDEGGRVKKNAYLYAGVVTFLFLTAAFLFMIRMKPYTDGDGGFWQYTELARALAEGRVYIDDDPSAELLSMDNPYDWKERALKDVPYRLDYVYYEGKYYVYFGLLPCLLFHLPYHLITGGDLRAWPVVLFLLGLVCISLFLLIFEYASLYGKKMSTGELVTVHTGMLAGLELTAAFANPNIYYIPQLSALACLIIGGIFAIRAAKSGSKKEILLSGLFIASIAGCRPQVIFAAAVYIPFFFMMLFKTKLQGKKDIGIRNSVFALPFVLIAALLMVYNALRFSDPLQFGFRYNMTFNSGYKNDFSLSTALISFYYYLFKPQALSPDFPFLVTSALSEVEWSNPEDLANEIARGGLFITVPFMLLAFGALCINKKEKDSAIRKRELLSLLCLVFAFVMVFTDGGKGGLNPRYKLDFVLLFGLPAFFTVLKLSEYAAKKGEKLQHMIRGVYMLLTFISCVYIFLTITMDYVWSIKRAAPELFSMMAEAVEFWR